MLKHLKEKMSAINELIEVCEDAIPKTAKSRRKQEEPKAAAKEDKKDESLDELLELHSMFGD